MKKFLVGVAALLIGATTILAQGTESRNPSTPSVGKDQPRSGFISYGIREQAEGGVRSSSQFYRPLKMQSPEPQDSTTYYITQTDIPYSWLDRDLFIHIGGAEAFYLYVNDKKVGFGTDSKSPSEFNLSGHVTNGQNTVRIESVRGSAASRLEFGDDQTVMRAPLGEVYLYSQPKLRVQDYRVVAEPDSLGRSGVLSVDVALSNSYNFDEAITVGYDIYSPTGKLMYYDLRDAKLEGHGRDTVRFKEKINGSMQNLWSASSPRLYKVMIYIKRAGRITEYIPLKIGFGKTEMIGGKIIRNGKPIGINAARYNAAPTPAQTKNDLTVLKSHSVNTICVDYPQQDWFYDLCDQIGLYVIDQANINNSVQRDNLKIGGTTSNDPVWLNSYIEREQSMFERNKNHCSIIAWSLGGESGNGYNMYRAYQYMKSLDPVRAVMYRDAATEWNSDMAYPECHEAQQIIEHAAVQPVKSKYRRR